MSGGSVVAVVQPTQSHLRNHSAPISGLNSPNRSLLSQAEMRAVFMVVADVFRKQPLQMAFVHCDDVVQQITAATLDPSLRDAVLPRTFEGGSDRPHLQGSNGCGNLDSVLAVTVKDKKPGS